MKNVCVVTVTYGDRFSRLAKETITRALKAGARHVVLVDNGSSKESVEEIRATYADAPNVTIELMGENTGSAPAFSRGIQLAAAQEAPYIWLLDDDNWVESDSLQQLLTVQSSSAIDFDDPLTSVCGRRDLDNNHQRVSDGLPVSLTYPPPGSFMFFDLITQLKRTLSRQRILRPFALAHLTVPEAPYGGFLFPTALLAEIGLPPEELRLYADDTIWTSRAVEMGHRIILVDSVLVHDADAKWAREGGRGPFGLLDTEQYEKLFYSVRNRVFYEKRRVTSRSLAARYAVNKTIYVALAWGVSKRRGSATTLSVFQEAIKHGENGLLDNTQWLSSAGLSGPS